MIEDNNFLKSAQQNSQKIYFYFNNFRVILQHSWGITLKLLGFFEYKSKKWKKY